MAAKLAAEAADAGAYSAKNFGFREHSVWQGFRGLLFGGKKSSNEVRAIGLNPNNGQVLLAGTSKPRGSDGEAWGSMAAGDVSGGSDIFFAHLTDRGELAWVRRAGAFGDEDMQAMAVTKYAAYLCGTTTGNMGSANAGRKDIFVMKYSLTGEKLWERAAQFGSDKDDVCKSIETSDETAEFPELYISGWTSGALFENRGPTGMETSHRFLARLIETGDAKAGNKNSPLRLVHGSQRGSIAMTSSDAVLRAPNNRLFVVSNTYNASVDADASATSIVEIYDATTLSVHKTMTFRVEGRSFCATSAAVEKDTGNLFVGGIGHSASTTNRLRGFYAAIATTATANPAMETSIPTSGRAYNESEKRDMLSNPGPRASFYAVRYSLEGNSTRDTQLWGVRLGNGVPTAVLSPVAKVSVAVDVERNLVHITGILDGLYLPSELNGEGFVSSPVYSLHTRNGSIAARVRRTTSFPHSVEYIASSILSADGKAVIYAGTAAKESPADKKDDPDADPADDSPLSPPTFALVGSLGSTAFVSQLGQSEPVTESLEAAGILSAGTTNEAWNIAEAAKEAEEESGSSGRSTGGIGAMGGAAVGVATVGCLLLAAVAMTSIGRKSSRRLEDSGFSGDSRSVHESKECGARNERIAGGSSAPQ